jgi:hypothetical protein
MAEPAADEMQTNNITGSDYLTGPQDALQTVFRELKADWCLVTEAVRERAMEAAGSSSKTGRSDAGVHDELFSYFQVSLNTVSVPK